ncbi:MAG: helix-turn-helix domain-containing protein [Gemmatimonadaceae bacterium]|nr:helix-turn-helix domain-containing protein [Gemmatimonadaceae bacterium]MCW5825890.1 helix-turn-helix domain-containing protein [Gemmatimonadaceae bacterium]
MPERLLGPLAAPHFVVCGARDRTKEALRRALPRRRARVTFARASSDLLDTLRTALVDGVVVDLGQPNDETWAAAALAREFPSIPFFAYGGLRPAELPLLARATTLEFADCIAEGVEDDLARDLMAPATFTVRFATALRGAEGRLGLETPLQHEAWTYIVAQGGRTVRTDAIAAAVGLTREHLSRRFASDGAPNLKRVIDLVRLLAAAELAKNPGYDLPDVARVLGFASASHLSGSCQRLVGVKSTSLARLRPLDLIDRFVKQGRGRSRG